MKSRASISKFTHTSDNLALRISNEDDHRGTTMMVTTLAYSHLLPTEAHQSRQRRPTCTSDDWHKVQEFSLGIFTTEVDFIPLKGNFFVPDGIVHASHITSSTISRCLLCLLAEITQLIIKFCLNVLSCTKQVWYSKHGR